MFGIEQDKLVKNLKILQQRICSCIGDTCDCKYDISDQKEDLEKRIPHGEKTGCPEVRQAIEILSVMPEDTFNKLCSAANYMVTIHRVLNMQAAATTVES